MSVVDQMGITVDVTVYSTFEYLKDSFDESIENENDSMINELFDENDRTDIVGRSSETMLLRLFFFANEII